MINHAINLFEKKILFLQSGLNKNRLFNPLEIDSQVVL